MSGAALRNVEQYLAALRESLRGADPALIQDALYDAEEHLRALQRKGVVELLPGASRGIQLRDSLREQLGLPLIGRVAAGKPILAEENIEARYQVDPQLFQPRPHYLLKVRGMSMRDVGILDGDLVGRLSPQVHAHAVADRDEVDAGAVGDLRDLEVPGHYADDLAPGLLHGLEVGEHFFQC